MFWNITLVVELVLLCVSELLYPSLILDSVLSVIFVI